MSKTAHARALRKRTTTAEQLLWRLLRHRQLRDHKFRRQHPLGPYVVDFFCMEEGLVIEVDGGQHALQRERDETRSAWLDARGFRVLRFWNNDVIANPEAVLQEVLQALDPD